MIFSLICPGYIRYVILSTQEIELQSSIFCCKEVRAKWNFSCNIICTVTFFYHVSVNVTPFFINITKIIIILGKIKITIICCRIIGYCIFICYIVWRCASILYWYGTTSAKNIKNTSINVASY